MEIFTCDDHPCTPQNNDKLDCCVEHICPEYLGGCTSDEVTLLKVKVQTFYFVNLKNFKKLHSAYKGTI